MLRLKTTFSPYVNDLAAFAILGFAVATTVFGVAAVNGKVKNASFTVSTSGYNTANL